MTKAETIPQLNTFPPAAIDLTIEQAIRHLEVLTSKPDALKPGDFGTSPSGIPYVVRPDGTKNFQGYGGAYD